MIRVPHGAVILDGAEVHYVAGALEQLAQLMVPAQPTPRLIALTAKLRRTVDPLTFPADVPDLPRQAIPSDNRQRVRAPQQTSADRERYEVGTAEAAHAIGITPSGVRDLARRGRLPARRTGTRWLYPASAVAAAAERRAAHQAG